MATAHEPPVNSNPPPAGMKPSKWAIHIIGFMCPVMVKSTTDPRVFSGDGKFVGLEFVPDKGYQLHITDWSPVTAIIVEPIEFEADTDRLHQSDTRTRSE